MESYWSHTSFGIYLLFMHIFAVKLWISYSNSFGLESYWFTSQHHMQTAYWKTHKLKKMHLMPIYILFISQNSSVKILVLKCILPRILISFKNTLTLALLFFYLIETLNLFTFQEQHQTSLNYVFFPKSITKTIKKQN